MWHTGAEHRNESVEEFLATALFLAYYLEAIY